jgi:signal transduction histidine kinase
MRRTWALWMLFAVCLVVGLVAMVWISMAVLRLDAAEAQARRQAHEEENVRLALWRMDSMLAPMIAQETARPYFAYSPFIPAEQAYTRMFAQIRHGEVLVPSPLLAWESPLVLVHFQFDGEGQASSPQAPAGEMRAIAARFTSFERMDEAGEMLQKLEGMLDRQRLLAALPEEAADQVFSRAAGGYAELLAGNSINASKSMPAQQAAGVQQQEQAARSINEFHNRTDNTLRQQNLEFNLQRGNWRKSDDGIVEGRIIEGVMRPLWVDDALVLARRVNVNGQVYVQGCWLNWPAIRGMLLEQVADLLPSAGLEPAGDERRPLRLLASIPVLLTPGAVQATAPTAMSPIRLTLIAAWAGVFVGAAALGLLVWGAMRLSARRGAFVSAVTHELRTPLTTVSMYAEMLENGMVRDEAQRRQYLGTLRAEAQRLGHLVENVLAYSRIERGRASGRSQELTLSQLLEVAGQRLAGRAEQAGMSLEIAVADGGDVAVRADASAVEQILFNLVDNAAKYASGAADRRIRLQGAPDGRCAVIRVADGGPGIATAQRRRLFRPFGKSASEAAHSAPGVGLGLALSRRLAREMGGDLVLEPANGVGASFALRLPRV